MLHENLGMGRGIKTEQSLSPSVVHCADCAVLWICVCLNRWEMPLYDQVDCVWKWKKRFIVRVKFHDYFPKKKITG